MAADIEKQMKEEMERASLKDVMPDFDAEQEWLNVAGKLQPAKKRTSAMIWRYAAALIVLLCASWLALLLFKPHDQQLAKKATPVKTEEQKNTSTIPSRNDQMPIDSNTASMQATANKKKQLAPKGNTSHNYTTRYTISNSTDCPMEISISQTMKCPNAKPAAISTSSTLEPGQSASLNYKGNDSVPRNCSLTTEEIEIKSIATGEAITLDAHSSPSTAQDVFAYISGEKRGDVLAGIFKLDCNHHSNKHSIRLDNRAGSIIMQ
jgi:hypothetical protein